MNLTYNNEYGKRLIYSYNSIKILDEALRRRCCHSESGDHSVILATIDVSLARLLILVTIDVSRREHVHVILVTIDV